jgi:hypothetical protein
MTPLLTRVVHSPTHTRLAGVVLVRTPAGGSAAVGWFTSRTREDYTRFSTAGEAR